MSQQEVLTIVAEVTLENGKGYEAVGRVNVAGMRAMPGVDVPAMLRTKVLEMLTEGLLMRVGVAIDPDTVTYRENIEMLEVEG